MPLIILAPEALPFEHMPQVTPAVRAHNLRPHHAQCAVFEALHGSRDGLVVGGPPTARVEFLARSVEWRGAAGASVDARVRVVLVVLAGARALCGALAEDAELLCGK